LPAGDKPAKLGPATLGLTALGAQHRPGAGIMDSEKLVTVYTASNVNQAEVIRLALEGNGIAAQVAFGHDQFNVTGLTRAEVLVFARDAVRARDLIQSHAVEHSPSDEELERMAEAEPAEPDEDEGLELDEGEESPP
jgi:hypothetical protein